jgi:methyltransferase family protein
MPPHYYSSVSSRRWLRRNETHWRHPSGLPGIDWDLDAQAAWVTEMAEYVPEIPLRDVYARARRVGGFRYGPVEAQLLYCFVRRKAPRRIVEVGSGSTTVLMAEAARRNAAEGRGGAEITAIDPYAHPGLSELSDVEVLKTDGLDISASELQLEAHDLLFIDSTHTVRTGSEVPHLYLELVPALPSDVWVHVHDIYLPFPLLEPDLQQLL